jgi:hypothetical protein
VRMSQPTWLQNPCNQARTGFLGLGRRGGKTGAPLQ